jgi:hypothetical protein
VTDLELKNSTHLGKKSTATNIVFQGILLLILLFATRASAQTLYFSLDAAHVQCRNDTVVWLNTRTDIYHFQGERWYGNTKEGAYVCERQAEAAGDRLTKNGQ